MQTLLQNGDQQIDGDRTPDLDVYGVRSREVQGFDAQMNASERPFYRGEIAVNENSTGQ